MDQTTAQLTTLKAMVAILVLDDLLGRHPDYRSTHLNPDERARVLTLLNTSAQFHQAVRCGDTLKIRRLARRHLNSTLISLSLSGVQL